MPSTYNGVGTSYVGKKNLSRREDTCQFCGRRVNVESYDTRLCFVILFIPIIPLARKRILNYCPVCRVHIPVDADKWETSRQLEVSGAVEQYESNPTPENALAAHGRMLAYHEFQRAADFRAEILQKFADNANVHAGIAVMLEQIGKIAEAAPRYERALEFRPDLPEARIGVASNYCRAGKLNEARALLDFLEKPGAGQLYGLGPLEHLADAYQKKGEHEPALELYAKLLEALPQIAQMPVYRKKVQVSEKALKSKSSLLPKRKWSFRELFSRRRVGTRASPARWLAIAAIVVAVVLIGIYLNSLYAKHHRHLYLVNAFDTLAKVEIQGIGTRTIGKLDPQDLVLPEGHYHAAVSGPVTQNFDFDVTTSGMDEWGKTPAWVLNVGGEAILVLARAHYRTAGHEVPPEITTYYGQPFVFLPDVSHPFQALPQTVQIDSSASEKVLTHLSVFTDPPSNLAQTMFLKHWDGDAMNFAEWELRRNPDDARTLEIYTNVVNRTGQTERLRKLLEQGLSRRPVAIEWHRTYQSIRRTPEEEKALRAQYDEFLAKQPQNSALCYLRGRIAGTPAEQQPFFERAIAADGNNPWPLFALAYLHAADGDWAGARPLLVRAHERDPENDSLDALYFETRFALGELVALEQEAKGDLAKNPLNAEAALRLCQIQSASGRNADAVITASAFHDHVTAHNDPSLAEFNLELQRAVLYVLGDFASLERSASRDRSPDARGYLVNALLEQGRENEIATRRLLPEDADRVRLLAMSMAFRLHGKTAEADDWLQRTEKAYAASDEDGGRVAALLRKSEAPSAAELSACDETPAEKALLLAALSLTHADQREALSRAAARLNVLRNFPYHFVQRAIGAKPGQPAPPLTSKP